MKNKMSIEDIRKVYDENSLSNEEIKELDTYDMLRIKEIIDGRKRDEKESGEHFEAKYKMYIVPHKSFVSDYENYGRGKLSGKRYCFRMDSHRKAILMNVEEVINCISDCANHYCNFRFKILPEDEFLREYEEYKLKHIKDLKEHTRRYGFCGEGFDIDNILHQKKIKKICSWGCLMRDYYGDVGIFGEPLNAIPFYSLYSDRTGRTSHIIDYKKTEEGIEFETNNSIYLVKELKGFDFLDQLKEFDDFKNSPHYKELIDFVYQYEDEIMKNIIEGKEYIN